MKSVVILGEVTQTLYLTKCTASLNNDRIIYETIFERFYLSIVAFAQNYFYPSQASHYLYIFSSFCPQFLCPYISDFSRFSFKNKLLFMLAKCIIIAHRFVYPKSTVPASKQMLSGDHCVETKSCHSLDMCDIVRTKVSSGSSEHSCSAPIGHSEDGGNSSVMLNEKITFTQKDKSDNNEKTSENIEKQIRVALEKIREASYRKVIGITKRKAV